MTADHPHTDPGDGRTECPTCGKFVWPVIHSCKGVPVTAAARQRHAERVRANLACLDGTTASAVSLLSGIPRDQLDQYGGASQDGEPRR